MCQPLRNQYIFQLRAGHQKENRPRQTKPHGGLNQTSDRHDCGLRTVDQGSWTQEWTRIVDSGPWTKDRGLRTVDSGPWTKDRGLRIVDSGLWTKDRGLRTVDQGSGGGRVWIRTVDQGYGLLTMDQGSCTQDHGARIMD
ncbi:hypothetical protein ACROYT_G044277 [Oculina patagonica]